MILGYTGSGHRQRAEAAAAYTRSRWGTREREEREERRKLIQSLEAAKKGSQSLPSTNYKQEWEEAEAAGSNSASNPYLRCLSDIMAKKNLQQLYAADSNQLLRLMIESGKMRSDGTHDDVFRVMSSLSVQDIESLLQAQDGGRRQQVAAGLQDPAEKISDL